MLGDEFYSLVGAVLPRKNGEIHRGTLLRRDLKADSLSFLELVLALEDRYHCYLRDDALALAVTVGDLEDLTWDSIGGAARNHEGEREESL